LQSDERAENNFDNFSFDHNHMIYICYKWS